jgi:tryptophan 2,3-dioxygenase
LNLRKAFENRQDRLLPAFKIGELALAIFQNRRVGFGCLSKSASWLWPAFKTGEMALAGFQKLSAQLREICCPIGAKDLNSPVLKRFLQIQKVFALNGKEFMNSI